MQVTIPNLRDLFRRDIPKSYIDKLLGRLVDWYNNGLPLRYNRTISLDELIIYQDRSSISEPNFRIEIKFSISEEQFTSGVYVHNLKDALKTLPKDKSLETMLTQAIYDDVRKILKDKEKITKSVEEALALEEIPKITR